MSKAKTIAKSQRMIYTQFAEMHCLSEDKARELGLPIGLVQRRRRRANMYCSEKYYNFIGDVIESTHVANLTLDMMMAYADGDIICEIKERILKSDAVKSKFAALCSTTDEATFSTEDTEKLLAYILDRYANMRGAYFVKHMRGCQNSSAGKLAQSQATRTKVLQSSAAASYSSSKVKSEQAVETEDEKTEKELWSQAETNVLQHSKSLEQEEDEARND